MENRNRTIVLKGKGHHEEGFIQNANGVKPGQPVAFVPGGERYLDIAPNATPRFYIAKEDALQGKTVDGQYVTNELTFIYKPLPGDHLMVRVAAGTVVTEGVDCGIVDGLFAVGGTVVGQFVETFDNPPAEETLAKIRVY